MASGTRLVAVCVLPLVVVYPFCKRFTHWPQAVLGAAFNWGLLMAWAEVAGHIPAGAVLMWIGAVAWQVGYDTVYAYVDVRDDARLGLKSTAILFGRQGKACIGLFYGLAVAAWSIGGWLPGMSTPCAIGMTVIAAHLAWQAWRLDLDRPEVNFRLFLWNILTGALLACTAFVATWRARPAGIHTCRRAFAALRPSVPGEDAAAQFRVEFHLAPERDRRVDIGLLAGHAPVFELVEGDAFAGDGAAHIGAGGENLEVSVEVAHPRFSRAGAFIAVHHAQFSCLVRTPASGEFVCPKLHKSVTRSRACGAAGLRDRALSAARRAVRCRRA